MDLNFLLWSKWAQFWQLPFSSIESKFDWFLFHSQWDSHHLEKLDTSEFDSWSCFRTLSKFSLSHTFWHLSSWIYQLDFEFDLKVNQLWCCFNSCPSLLWWLQEKPEQSCKHSLLQSHICKSSFSDQDWYHWNFLYFFQISNNCSIGTSEKSASFFLSSLSFPFPLCSVRFIQVNLSFAMV